MFDLRPCLEASSADRENTRSRVVKRPDPPPRRLVRADGAPRSPTTSIPMIWVQMTVPLRSLPLVQNWTCHSCSDCCRIEAVITDEEKRRIEALDLADDPEVAPQPWFAPAGRGPGKWNLRQRPDGGCFFLTAENRCRIQERFGAEAKPFVCRLFPFVLI